MLAAKYRDITDTAITVDFRISVIRLNPKKAHIGVHMLPIKPNDANDTVDKCNDFNLFVSITPKGTSSNQIPQNEVTTGAAIAELLK